MSLSSNNLIIGIGNDYRQDDAIGLIVVRDIRDKNLPNLQVAESSGDVAELMELWKDADWVLAVDALSSGGVPGSVTRFQAHEQALPTETFRHSTHALSLPEAIEMARALDQLPKTLVVLGIEGKTFAAGQNLSEEIGTQRHNLVEQVMREIPKP